MISQFCVVLIRSIQTHTHTHMCILVWGKMINLVKQSLLFFSFWFASTNPNSHSIPLPPPLPLGNHKYVLHVCESVSVSWTVIAIYEIITSYHKLLLYSSYVFNSIPLFYFFIFFFKFNSYLQNKWLAECIFSKLSFLQVISISL